MSIAAILCDEKISDFLSLPLELRERIYNFCFQDSQQEYEDCGPIGTPKFNIRAPLPQLRLANRQVKTEYDKHWPKNTALDFSVAYYNPFFTSFGPLPRLPRRAAMSTVVSVELEFHKVIWVHYDLPPHLTILEFIPAALPNLVEDLPLLERLNVSLRFGYQDCGWMEKVIRSFEKLDAMFEDVRDDYPGLAKLAELKAVWTRDDGVSRNVAFVTWSPGGGVWYDREALHARLRDCAQVDRCPETRHRGGTEALGEGRGSLVLPPLALFSVTGTPGIAFTSPLSSDRGPRDHVAPSFTSFCEQLR